MDREQEEAVQRITARYVAEQRAGHHPRLSDYLSRYPQFADAITDFVTYYHAIEANIPEEIGVVSPLSQATRVALDEARRRVLRPESVAPAVNAPLQKAANNAGKSFSQLAVEIGLSLDILEKLEQHIVDSVMWFLLDMTTDQHTDRLMSDFQLGKSVVQHKFHLSV